MALHSTMKMTALAVALGSGLVCQLAQAATSQSATAQSSTSLRPLLTTAQAAEATLAAHFARTGAVDALRTESWDPRTHGIGDVAAIKPAFVVAADGSGQFTALQPAIDAAMQQASGQRVSILIKPGVYRGQVCIKGKTPVTLYAQEADASKVVIVDNKSNGTAKPEALSLNDCESRSGKDTYGTSGSSTLMAFADDFQAKNLTIANDFDESTASKGLQAVALTTTGDRQIFENVRILGNQDSLQVKSRSSGVLARSYFRDSYVEGDVDFVFGRGVAAFEQVEFKSLARKGVKEGYVFAPSHPQNYPVGFLVLHSRFTADDQLKAASTALGRAWDDSSGAFTTSDGQVHLPNGQLIVRDSAIGAHINGQSPWAAAATTKRPFSASASQTVEYAKADATFPPNRLFEYGNSVLTR